MRLNSKALNDVTFVVQGSFDNYFELKWTVQNIRTTFPEAKVIISTWANSKFIDEDRDFILVLNDDPGPSVFSGDQWGKNFDRQCVSTLNGLRQVKTKYAIKMRSDCYFVNRNLLVHIHRFFNADFALLHSGKMIRPCYPLYGNDWFQFGLTETLKALWENASSIGVDNLFYQDGPRLFCDPCVNYLGNLHPEQVLYIAQFPCKIRARDNVTIKDFLYSFFQFSRVNYTVGRIQIGLRSKKHKWTFFDYKPKYADHKYIVFIRIILCILFTAYIHSIKLIARLKV